MICFPAVREKCHNGHTVATQLSLLTVTIFKSFVVSSLFFYSSAQWLCTYIPTAFTLRASNHILFTFYDKCVSFTHPFDVHTMRFFLFFLPLTCPSLTSILFVFTCCYLRRVSCKDLWHCLVSLLFSPSLTLPRTFPFSQRQNKLIRSEVRAYQ